MKIAPVNRGFLLIGVTLTFLLIIITYIPWENSNYNGLPDCFLEMIPIKIFEFLTIPSGYILDTFFQENQFLITVILIHLLNLIIYGFFIERILTFFIDRIKSA
ncbi:hypothetical protein BTO05_08300 [Winogradskyella sp. PC-19]|jgi:hypothetical protein|uniref:hypothetical protein n=1 Tax=unclassified Winogradskyella TaxID=2615021 RepID=UPI000B3CF098|nr:MULTISPECIES: hypothetical protein [unclassified Winogradskyella]ARV09641.1 hypothetical protein BTO05_08300 [Winogradskyella sp. PC-19]RZN83317.1 MAG: hypothetical protein EVB12_01790 [Winogradskyella sp.]